MTTRSRHWRWPRLIAHRGGGTLAPENTLAGFRTGHAHGFHMMEYDVKLTQDGVPILLHDDDIARTSDGAGLAGQLPMAELLRQDFGAWHSLPYAGEPIPTLYAIAAYTLAHGICSNIEIKPHTGTDTQTGYEVARIAKRLWQHADSPPLLSSFSEAALHAAREAAPDLPRALLIDGAVPGDWHSRAERLGCVGLNLDHNHVSEALVRDVISANYTLVVWTVNDTARARTLLDWGCDAVVTDNIAAINPATFSDYTR